MDWENGQMKAMDWVSCSATNRLDSTVLNTCVNLAKLIAFVYEQAASPASTAVLFALALEVNIARQMRMFSL
jgi:hypothetical protein